MKKTTALISLLSMFISTQVFAYGLGLSTHPFEENKKVITTEATGTLANNSGSGGGIQARYYQRVGRDLNVDGGFGVSSSTAARSLFVGTDYMFFPDYGNQPRLSLKGTFANVRELDQAKNNIGLTPTVSKGFNLQGHEIFPFFALPTHVSLDWNGNQYRGASAVAMGLTSQIPFDGFEKLTANLEANLNLKNSYTGMFLGISYPLN